MKIRKKDTPLVFNLVVTPNLQLESGTVINHGLKNAIEMLIRALIRAGYTVSFIDGILLKQQQIPPEWLYDAQSEKNFMEIDGKKSRSPWALISSPLTTKWQTPLFEFPLALQQWTCEFAMN
jgi:hypothetical protein